MKKTGQLFLIIGLTIVAFGIGFWLSRYFTLKPITNQESQISAIIVPHHDLVRDKRDQFIKDISQEIQPKTIIISSPNHFEAGSGNILTTDKEWQLNNAKVLPDKEVINRLISEDKVTSEQAPFEREHGIFNLLEPAQKNFPDAKIVPIIIKSTTEKDQIKELSESLNTLCRGRCLLIASVDFSHYQPGALAEIHDSLSIRALSNLDEEAIWRTEVDSEQSLYLAILWAKVNKTEKFHLEENTNSGKIENNPDAETTSYVFGWYEGGQIASVPEKMTFMFAGDVMFDRHIQYKFQNDLKESFENLGERFFWGTDVSLVNLEGPISPTKTQIDTNPENLIFNFPPETAEVLKSFHLDAVSLANNHTLNASRSGLENTKTVLSEEGIVAIGEPNKISEDSVKRFSSGQKTISIIAVNAFDQRPDLEEIISNEKQAGAYIMRPYIIVYPHWGNEYQKTHSSSQENLAHSWIDAGADLIIGSHPHVIQDAELYNNRPIFYSLGNLLFDQPFSRETQQGLVLAGKISDEKLELVFLPIKIKNYQPELMSGEEKQNVINQLKEDLGQDISPSGYGYDTIVIGR